MFHQDQMDKRVMAFCRSLCCGLTLEEMRLARHVLGEEIAKREILREVERKGYFAGFEKYEISGLSCLELKAKLSLSSYERDGDDPKAWRVEGFDDSLEDELDHWFEVFECADLPADAKWEMEGKPELTDGGCGEPLYTATGLAKVYLYWVPPKTPIDGEYLVLYPEDLRAARLLYKNGVVVDDLEIPAAGAVVIAKER